jgi:hypothetical protein
MALTYWISLEAKVAVPELRMIIHLAVRIQNCSAIVPGAQNWFIHDRRQVVSLFEWLIQYSEWNYEFLSFHTT